MLRFGLRNAFRSPVRLVVTALLLGLPVFLMLAMLAIDNAVETHTDALRRNVDNTLQLRARGEMGHVNMVGNEHLLPAGALETVRRIPHVAQVESYLLAMTPTEGFNFAMVVGLVPGTAKRLESHGEAGNPRILAGRDLTTSDMGRPVVLIGQGVARWAGIDPNRLNEARLTLDLTRTHPVIFALDRPPARFDIVGVYASGYLFGDMQMFIPQDTFRAVYGVPEGYSWLFVQADSSEHLAQVERDLRAKLGTVADVIAPTSAAEFQGTATRAVNRLSRAAEGASAVLMAIVLFFVMLFVVRERSAEIGACKALGASNFHLVAAYAVEALTLCAAGVLVGALAFAALGTPSAQRLFGLGVAPFLPAPYQDTLGEALALSAALTLQTLFELTILALLATLAGAAWGLWQIARLSPMEAMRHE